MSRKLQTYEGKQIVVTYDPNLCIHSGVCVRSLNAVFDVGRERWIRVENASADEIAATIDRCPSGALRYLRY